MHVIAQRFMLGWEMDVAAADHGKPAIIGTYPASSTDSARSSSSGCP
jgi:hypothetical protein